MYCLLIIQNASLVKFDHHHKRSLSGTLMGVVQQAMDKSLQLSVHANVFRPRIDLLQIGDDNSVQELSQLFVLAPEELEEERKKARKNAETRKKYRELES